MNVGVVSAPELLGMGICGILLAYCRSFAIIDLMIILGNVSELDQGPM